MQKKYGKIIVDSMDGVSKNWHTPFDQYNTREIYGSHHYVPDNNMPMQVLFVNDEHCYEGYYRKRERSDVFSIELVLEGSMLFIQDGNEYRVMPGEIFFVHLDRENEVSTGPEKNCHRLACALTGKSLNNLLYSTRLIEYDIMQLQDQSPVPGLMRQCFEVFKQMRGNYRKQAASLAFQLLLELSENLNKTDRSEIVDKVIRLMGDHLSQHLSLNDFANLVGTSRSALTGLFRRHVNESPVNYYIFLKMEAAKSLLLNTKLQIQEIANMVGYDNSLYFSTEFKKRIGLSPRKYRQRTFKSSAAE